VHVGCAVYILSCHTSVVAHVPRGAFHPVTVALLWRSSSCSWVPSGRGLDKMFMLRPDFIVTGQWCRMQLLHVVMANALAVVWGIHKVI
jgi:hypothetical protein